MAIEDAVVLADVLGSDVTLRDALERFMDRRYARCESIWNISRQIGRWELDHTPPPEADFVGLTMKSVQETAAPV
jgi:2-polyprenyl-6-methoxyphenol hydroxylase-like FAD-dependent oxidoreductase